ncbi:putative uncharacterized protein [Clostridium sp. CAG:230]|nr:putative uncharacterized protein [Clostridium sp. CAG:230]
MDAYQKGFDQYNVEYGNLSTKNAIASKDRKAIEKENKLILYEQNYYELKESKKNATIRIYGMRKKVNTLCLMSGTYPKKDNEIALDRVYAKNNNYKNNDTIRIAGKNYTITGMVAFPDYSCLFSDNADMMFDSVNFGVAVMTEKALTQLDQNKLTYNYAWYYQKEPKDDAAQKKMSDRFLEKLTKKVIVTSYVPRYANKAINFTGDDMGGDKAMFILFDYIVIVILAFVFAITTSNTIAKEAGVIGTLRASGYTKGELLRHYMVNPVLVTLIAAVIGNILGYTALVDMMAGMYYNSYSLPTYHTLWNAEAFIDTTVIPVILMFLVNFLVLSSKLKISPLQFLRREITKKPRKKAFRLNTKIPFMHRFRLRVVFQNISNYSTLFIGIFFAAVIVIFSLMFGPLLDDYSTMVGKSVIAKYQYALKAPVDTKSKDAEKYCVESLKTLPGKYMEDEITIYGVQKNSNYIKADIPAGEVLVSNGYWEKFGVKKGDKITLKDPYRKKKYTFKVAGYYTYDAVLAVFMNTDDFCNTFDKEKDYYSGYFSKKKLKDIPKEYVASVITVKDLRKVSTQLKVSMGNYMELLQYFGVIMFILLMYLLSKQIIEKNSNSIALTKILGYTNGEIGGLYIITTFIVVVLSLLLTIPLVDQIMKWMFTGYLYTQMTGYIPYIVSDSCYVKMLIMGIFSYLVVCLIQIIKIQKIPKSDALKNLE